MRTAVFVSLFFCTPFFLASCKSGPCLRKDAAASQEQQPAVVNDEKTPTPKHSRVRVAKPDGSLQCGKGKQISLTEMSKQLSGIRIYTEENLNDGLMRIQVCGAPTGQHNVFEISQEDLKKAIGAGFKQWLK